MDSGYSEGAVTTWSCGAHHSSSRVSWRTEHVAECADLPIITQAPTLEELEPAIGVTFEL